MTNPTPEPARKRAWVLHPFLLAMHAVLSPLATNIGSVALSAIRTLVIGLLAVTLLLALLRILTRDSLKAALLTSGIVLLFGSYGHVMKLLQGAIALPGWSGIVLLVAWLLLLLIWARWVLRGGGGLRPVNTFLNLAGGMLLIMPLYTIVTYTRNTPDVQEHALRYRRHMLEEAGVLDLASPSSPGQPARDIIYLILDGYARADVLQELYGFDNAPFLSELEQMGFYIPAAGRANYADSVYSMASSLNMAHVADSPEFLRSGLDADNEAVLSDALAVLIHRNRVAEYLRDQGYEFVAFDSGYGRTAISSADVFAQSPDVPPFNAEAAFELVLMDTTLWNVFLQLRGEDYVPLQSMFDHHRGRVLYTLDQLSEHAARAGPQFIFAHVISPHAPYVFGSHGEPRYGVDPFTLLDQPAVGEWSPDSYRDQVIYINSLVLKELKEILERSEIDPIILIQADHSARAWGVPDPPLEIRQKLLFPIFAAFHLPGGLAEAQPYADISPVNVFRLVLNRYFDAQLQMLPDESYLLVEQDGHQVFVDACSVLPCEAD